MSEHRFCKCFFLRLAETQTQEQHRKEAKEESEGESKPE